MTTNQEIDRLVAVHVMGWRWVEDDEQPDMLWWVDEQGVYWDPDAWHPSEAIDDAWRVVERIKDRGLQYEFVRALLDVCGFTQVEVRTLSIECGLFETGPMVLWCMAYAPARERCLAALRAVGVEVDDGD